METSWTTDKNWHPWILQVENLCDTARFAVFADVGHIPAIQNKMHWYAPFGTSLVIWLLILTNKMLAMENTKCNMYVHDNGSKVLYG